MVQGAICPEADFDPRDPGDWVLNEDAHDTLLRSWQCGHYPSLLEQFWYLHSVPF